jgi:hypothetical protein
MSDRYRAPGGWTVQVIELTGTPDHHDGPWIRVSQYGFWVESWEIAFEGRDPVRRWCAALSSLRHHRCREAVRTISRVAPDPPIWRRSRKTGEPPVAAPNGVFGVNVPPPFG